MLIKDSYLLAASNLFEIKGRQEVTVNIKLTKVPPCYHTILKGRVLHKNIPIKGAMVKVFDCKYNLLFHTMTNCRGKYQFHNILAPGIYKLAASADGYRTSRMRKIRIMAYRVTKKTFYLKKCVSFKNCIVFSRHCDCHSKKSTTA
jgi:hypothetical protein